MYLFSMMRRHGKVKVLTGLLIPVFVLYCLMTWTTDEAKVSLKDGKPCETSLGPTLKDDMEKIQSYSFPEVEKYLKDLFPPSLPDDTNLPQMPTFVTAASGTHFIELKMLYRNISDVLNKYKQIKFVVFDLGLSQQQNEWITAKCKCQVTKFPFSDLPEHVKLMKGYAWKPIAIQLVAKDHPFVVWMDTSVRFTTTDLDIQFETARNLGVMAAKGFAPVAMRTHPKTFQTLSENACTFKETDEFEATLIFIFGNKFVSEYFLKPWVSCALTFGCMVPDYNYKSYLNCLRTKEQGVYFDCHRFDQSVLSILLYRLYHKNIMDRRMNHTFFRFCKGGEDHWYFPNFVNDLIIQNQSPLCF